MVGDKLNKQKVVIFAAGTPPIGSWHQRIRMFEKGFSSKGLELIHIVPYPAPTFETKKSTPKFGVLFS